MVALSCVDRTLASDCHSSPTQAWFQPSAPVAGGGAVDGASIVVQWGRKVGVRARVSIALLQGLAVTLSIRSCSSAAGSGSESMGIVTEARLIRISSAKTQSTATFRQLVKRVIPKQMQLRYQGDRRPSRRLCRCNDLYFSQRWRLTA